jgi:amino-acid N-acetyltransferase
MSEMFNIRPARSEDLQKVKNLLLDCGLHGEGVIDYFGDGYVVAEHGIEMIGVCGIEVYNVFGLLRSVAVSRKWQGRSLGRALVENRIAWAKAEGIRALYLLTLDADRYFERNGFRRVRREDVPVEIKGSLEFKSLCPETAIVMVKSLNDI